MALDPEPVLLFSPGRRVSRYLLATAILGAATLLRMFVDPLVHDQIPYFVYVAAVVVATWFCRVEGGIFTTVVSAFTGNYFFVPPRYEVWPHSEDWVAMGLFAAVAFGLVWLVGRWKNAEEALRAQADRLSALNVEAERANRLKDEFLATLSHELRTPLNAILGWAFMLDRGQLDPERQRTAVGTIVRNAEAQKRLIEDVLDLSRIVSGKMRIEMAPVELAAVVAAAIEMVRPAAHAKEIDLVFDLAPGALILGDADRLQQIAWNLLSNAVKFTPKHGRVAVRVEPENSYVTLTVSDSGIGIEADFVPHLFERFRQADGSSARQHGGLGLGLALVRHLTELHGGTVGARSAGRDQGTTVAVTFPVRAVSAAREAGGPRDADATPDAAPRQDTLRGIRVLVVDDEADARELVAAVLGPLGAHVRRAGTAAAALEALRAWRPHVLLADIGMPVEDGYALIASVRALGEAEGGMTPAAALTAYAGPADRTRVLAAGFQEHIVKPALPEDLARAVERLARGASATPGTSAAGAPGRSSREAAG